MQKSKILLTGGHGLLGQELQKHLSCYAPSSQELDITKPFKKKEYDLVIHSAAYTDVVKAEVERFKCYHINVFGTFALLKSYYDTPFVYISSEYAKNPVNYYSKTKLAGEVVVQAIASSYLIIRTLFKPVPFPHDKAFIDQYTQGDSIDVIAPLIAKAIKRWDKISKTIYIGTGRKTIYDIAKKSNPKVGKMSIKDIKDVVLPNDYL